MTIATLAVIESAVHDLLAGFLHGAAQRHACSRLSGSAPARVGGTGVRLRCHRPCLPLTVGMDTGPHTVWQAVRAVRAAALCRAALCRRLASCDTRVCHQHQRARGPAGVVPDIQLGVILYTILGVATVVKVALYGARALP
jgi:hypothetical protein